jgi:hypothetical protein
MAAPAEQLQNEIYQDSVENSELAARPLFLYGHAQLEFALFRSFALPKDDAMVSPRQL